MRDEDTGIGHEGLDPEDWSDLRALGHRMLDDMMDYLEGIRDRPVWQPIPDEVRGSFRAPLPAGETDPAALHRTFMDRILPYAIGNAHPGFMGWVNGGGTPVGMLAEMLAAGLNANLGGRDHVPIEVERQVVAWVRALFDFPETASGLFVTGTSLANFIAILTARRAALGPAVRTDGLGGAKLVAYASKAAHGCIAKAMDMAGLGSAALRVVPVDGLHRVGLADLRAMIAADRQAGFSPFLVVGNAGTVDIGAIDDLDGLADIAAAEGVWFHIDGAYGALGVLSPAIKPRLKGIERADSIAFDFHKWGQVPYDSGFVLMRDGSQQFETFATPAAYLRRETRGAAAGTAWPCDFGPDLSRGFRALKAWFTLQAFGTERLGAVIGNTCALARYLADRIEARPELELAAPVQLNIVCFRHRGGGDRLNADIVADLHESGIAVPSTTVLDGRVAIRAAIVNHRTGRQDLDAMLDAVLRFGAARLLHAAE